MLLAVLNTPIGLVTVVSYGIRDIDSAGWDSPRSEMGLA